MAAPQPIRDVRDGAGKCLQRLMLRREGPDHAPKFVVEVSTPGQEHVTGEGRSKREAEQAAARAMMQRLGLLEA